MSEWHIYDHYGYALVAILGTFIAMAALLWLMFRSVFSKFTSTLKGVAPPFINIIGVLFGLTLAFLANDTWNAHDKAINSVYKEGDAIRSLVVLSENIPQPIRKEVATALIDYGNACVEEWQLLAERRVSTIASIKSDRLLLIVSSPELANKVGNNLQNAMFSKISEIRSERDLRLSLSQTHINPLKWLGMAFLGLLTLVSVAIVHTDNPRAAAVATLLFALASAPTAAIVLVQGNPFQKPFAVSPEPISLSINALKTISYR